jgi:tRNA threonylcarbamoyladenosine biosynthesis protein TsaB
MAFILHLETATKVCSVALSYDGLLLDAIDHNEDAYMHGEQLTLHIKELMKRAGKDLSHLNAISVSSGPGSYTGLRIGVSTAKGLCYALSIPLIAVNTLEAMIALSRQKYPDQTVCALIDARRMEAYTLIQGKDGSVLKPVSADILEEDTYNTFLPFVAIGDGAPKCQEIWKDWPVVFDLELEPSARGQVTLAYQKFQQGTFEDVAYFEPNYVKPFYQAPATQK